MGVRLEDVGSFYILCRGDGLRVLEQGFGIMILQTILHTATYLTFHQLCSRGCAQQKFRLCPFAVYNAVFGECQRYTGLEFLIEVAET